MAAELDPRHLDKRTSARYAQRGQLDPAELERHLQQLPDLAEKVALVETPPPGVNAAEGEEDDEDGEEA